MIRPHPTKFGRWFWETTARIGISRQFMEVQIRQFGEIDSSKSILLMGNHHSWWDGFWGMDLNRRLWKKDFYVMMLEEQLSRRPFMRQTGAFSVKPGSRDALSSVDFAIEICQNPANLLLLFPQGRIHSQYDSTFYFGAAARRILNECPDCQPVFFASFLDYSASPKPGLFLYLEEANKDIPLDEAYRRFYQKAREEQISLIDGEHA